MNSDLKKLAKEEFNKLKIPPEDSSYDLVWYWWRKAFESAWGVFEDKYTFFPRPIPWTKEQWLEAIQQGQVEFRTTRYPPGNEEESNIRLVNKEDLILPKSKPDEV